jgi:hypothetical protein
VFKWSHELQQNLRLALSAQLQSRGANELHVHGLSVTAGMGKQGHETGRWELLHWTLAEVERSP